MSFLFKSSKKGGGAHPANALPPATREIRSSDGQSQIPTLNGMMNGSSRVGSPTPQGPSVNNSMNSLAPNGNGGERSTSAPPQEDKAAYIPALRPDGVGARGSGPPSPEQKSLGLRERSQESQMSQRLPLQQQVQARPAPTDASPYPWSQRRLTFTVSHTNPFPRYGAAVNATGSKDGAVYLMGGLINGSTVKGDLWMVEAGPGNMTCYPVATTSEGPGPRVGHASLLVGNAFIVFGGDTKMDEGDQLDDTLYLLNTSTKQWSRALPAGPRPPGRYGHTLNILGSKIYIFGGQVEGYFFNDLVAFDLNALQQATNRWEILIQNTIDGGPPHGQIPPARTNHTMISWNDRLYLFGGTDGVHWFNDVWSYSPQTNSWTQLECIGYIPSPREGHAAALVGDVMYIFGGRTEEGNDLGDLAAFRITSRRWYTFQNMGPSPSPRSGHSMTTIGKQIVVLAGEPSSAPRDPVELGMAYFLDTGKIRYPPDSASQTPANERIQGTRRPSGEKNALPMTAARGQLQQAPAELADRPRMNSGDSVRTRAESNSRLPRIAGGSTSSAAPSPAPTGPPPQAPQQARTNGVGNGVVASRQPTRPPDRAFSPANDAERALRFENSGMVSPPPANGARDSPVPRTETRTPTIGWNAQDSDNAGNGDAGRLGVRSPTFAQDPTYFDSSEEHQEQPPRSRSKPETYQPSQDQSLAAANRSSSRAQQRNLSTDLMDKEETPRQSVDATAAPEQMPKVRELQQEDSNPEGPQDSGIGSSPALGQQYDDLAKELEQAKQKNAWFASELALARKSGYQSRPGISDSPVLLDERATDVFADDDKPLIEALLKMRAELTRVQDTIEEQSRSAAERIAEMEKQRDSAVHEAVFAKAKLAGQSPVPDGMARAADQDRGNEVSKRLASSLAAQGELSRRVEGLVQDVEAERKARVLAEDTAEAAQKRVTELDVFRQQHSSEIESLRGELHETRAQARDLGASYEEVKGRHGLLEVDRRELSGRLEGLLAEQGSHVGVLASLREAVAASTEKSGVLERRLEEEREGREGLEGKLRVLRAEHEERTGELESTRRRLREAEEMGEKHAVEAKTHREAVLAGLGKVADRGVDPAAVNDERVVLLQQQAEAAQAMVRSNQAAADAASEKLRRAEERIAGLEAYQEQASREGLSIRKQLQAAMRENQGLAGEKSELEQKYQGQMLETNALAVQHSSLKDILAERGVNAAEVRRSRALDSPSSLTNRFSTPDLHRVRELEQQLEASLKSHDEMKNQFEEVAGREGGMRREYEEKLTALDNDHQAAVKYLRGTEKMLSKMKQELQRVKNENGDLRKRTEKLRDESRRGTPDVPADWEAEREGLRKEVEQAQLELKHSVGGLEARIEGMQQRLQGTERELEQTRSAHQEHQLAFTNLQAEQTQHRDDLERLQQENVGLEERAKDAEKKVQLLLDQVESSVDNYRRQSRRMSGMTPTMMNGTAGPAFHLGHARGVSGASASTAAPTAANHTSTGGGFGGSGHSRNISDAGESTYSAGDDGSNTPGGGSVSGGHDDGRNSLALDSLASELDALRSHWETTNKNYRLSDDRSGGGGLEGSSASGNAGTGSEGFMGAPGSLASWRRGLDIGDEGDEEDSRPGTSDGTVRGEDEGLGRGHAA